MTYLGHVKQGKVILDGTAELTDGTRVEVRPIVKRPTGRVRKRSVKPAVTRGLLALAGKAKGLPRDAARNVEHYLYGHPKR